MNVDKFTVYLHSDFILLLKEINDRGFKVGIVGGTTRDYLMGKPCRHDYDCELRLVDNKLELIPEFEKLKSWLDENYSIEKLPYNITRIHHDNFECELTLPRLEIYSNNFSHSNFEAKFVNDTDYKSVFNRRDFTINAIMYEYNYVWNTYDPFNGVQDIIDKTLRPCSIDFYKDPVRFLRAIRFSMDIGFQIDKEVLDQLKTIELEAFSSHYLRKEGIRSGKPVCFALSVFEYTGYNVRSKFLNELMIIEQFPEDLKTHLNSLVFLEKEVRDEVSHFYDFSLRHIDCHFPLNLSKLVSESDDDLAKLDSENNLIATFKKISGLEQKYFNYLVDFKLIDLSYEEVQKLNSIKVDLQEIAPSERKLQQFKKKIEAFFGNS